MNNHMVHVLRIVAAECHEIAKSKGWHDNIEDQRERLLVATRVALVHSEASEALEAGRVGDFELRIENGKPEGFVVEMADVVIRAFDCCAAMGLDISNAIAVKCEYNRTREHRHGGKTI